MTTAPIVSYRVAAVSFAQIQDGELGQTDQHDRRCPTSPVPGDCETFVVHFPQRSVGFVP